VRQIAQNRAMISPIKFQLPLRSLGKQTIGLEFYATCILKTRCSVNCKMNVSNFYASSNQSIAPSVRARPLNRTIEQSNNRTMYNLWEKIIESTAAANEVSRQRDGALFVDRTIGVTIVPSRVTLDLKRFMRLEMIETTDCRDDILRIAEASFTYDRRFNLTPDCDPQVRHEELKKWVDDLGPTWVALMKGVPVGFMNLREVPRVECRVPSAECRVPRAECLVQSAECRVPRAECRVQSAECRVQSAECHEVALSTKHRALSTSPSTRHIALAYHLVAVEEKYRLSGAALGLYAKGIEVARERGYQKLVGRISSQNVAVMNIYAMFGAQFGDPQDIFFRRRP